DDLTWELNRSDFAHLRVIGPFGEADRAHPPSSGRQAMLDEDDEAGDTPIRPNPRRLEPGFYLVEVSGGGDEGADTLPVAVVITQKKITAKDPLSRVGEIPSTLPLGFRFADTFFPFLHSAERMTAQERQDLFAAVPPRMRVYPKFDLDSSAALALDDT